MKNDDGFRMIAKNVVIFNDICVFISVENANQHCLQEAIGKMRSSHCNLQFLKKRTQLK